MSSSPQTTANQDSRGERKRKRILRELLRQNGRATTSQLNNELEYGSELIRYHCGILENERSPSLLTLDGKEQERKGRMASNIYRLTEHGAEVAEMIEDDDIPIREADTFAELRSELARTKEDLRNVNEEVAQLKKAYSKLASKVKNESP